MPHPEDKDAIEENADLLNMIGVTEQDEQLWADEMGECLRICCDTTRDELEVEIGKEYDRGFNALECACNHKVGLLGCSDDC